MALLPRRGHVLVALVVRVPRSLVLEVLFVVVRLVVLPTRWLGLGHRGSVLPQELVHQQLLLHRVDVHVGDGREAGLGHLGSSDPPPVGLHSLHVPLVHHRHDVLGLERPELLENALVPEINQNLLLLGGALGQQGDEEVDPASVHGFSEGLSSPGIEDIVEIIVLTGPRRAELACLEDRSP